MNNLPTLDSLRVEGKTVLVRSDLNVPLDEGEVADDFRIGASLPTIKALLDRGAKVVVCSHLGRPKGVDEGLRMDPVARRMSELGGFPVNKIDVVAGPQAEAAIAATDSGTVTLLENTRFEAGEKKNDPELAGALARLADLFVLDAFGTAHRAHATTVGVAERLRSAAGLLLEKEVAALSALLTDPERPYVVILGGAKVSDKLAVMEHLLPKVDQMIVGGGMCFTLLRAQGYEVGNSLVEESMLEVVGGLLGGEYGHKILLPTDVVAAAAFAEDADHEVVRVDAIPEEMMGLDIGPDSIASFRAAVDDATSVFWNGRRFGPARQVSPRPSPTPKDSRLSAVETALLPSACSDVRIRSATCPAVVAPDSNYSKEKNYRA